jgi:hypothetical protein
MEDRLMTTFFVTKNGNLTSMVDINISGFSVIEGEELSSNVCAIGAGKPEIRFNVSLENPYQSINWVKSLLSALGDYVILDDMPESDLSTFAHKKGCVMSKTPSKDSKFPIFVF